MHWLGTGWRSLGITDRWRPWEFLVQRCRSGTTPINHSVSETAASLEVSGIAIGPGDDSGVVKGTIAASDRPRENSIGRRVLPNGVFNCLPVADGETSSELLDTNSQEYSKSDKFHPFTGLVYLSLIHI